MYLIVSVSGLITSVGKRELVFLPSVNRSFVVAVRRDTPFKGQTFMPGGKIVDIY